MLKEFKKFAFRGNVIDLAIGVIIGAAFGKIVTSLVGDIMMPIIGLFTAGVDFKSLTWVVREATVIGEVVKPAIIISYGNFLQNILDFFIIAITIFFLVRAINRRRIKEERKAAEEKAKLEALAVKEPTVPELLVQIRDLLQSKKGV